ncbi:flagellar protein FlgN [Novosphingobium sp. BL-8A]|uniref:flagellar protein FlgN n=1 Tax=Novosphingobium sp. BL-8A TaxID=3127639 RepID=UPI0037571138
MTQTNPAGSGSELHETLRQMLAVLESERQALAGLDLDAIVCSTLAKDHLCGALEGATIDDLDDECRGMVETAKRLNEVNRQVRNIIAANVAKRLDVLTGTSRLYRAGTNYALAAGRR